MKKLLALLAVIGFVPSAYAAEGADISWNGEYRLIYNNDMNADFTEGVGTDGDSTDQSWNQRTRLGVTARAGEKMTFNGMFVHNTNFGANADQYPGGDVDSAGDANATEQNSLVINEAYMSWMIKEDLMMRVGRGNAQFADGSVVGSNDWEPVRKAFDGALIAWMHERVDVKAFGVWGGTGTSGDGSATNNYIGRFFGVSADFKSLPDFLKTAHLHYIVVKRDEGAYSVNGASVVLPEENTNRIGLTVGGDTAGVDYKLTYAMYQGETGIDTTTDVDASMMELEVGYSIPAAMNMRVHVGHHTDSGDDAGTADSDEGYNPFHYNAHENAGLMDVVGWGNLTYNRVGVTFSPADDIKVAAEYLMFTETEEAGTTDEIGDEMDLTVSKKYGANFNTALSYRTFKPSDDVGTDDRSQLYLEGKLTF